MFLFSNNDNAKDLADEDILIMAKAKPWLFGVLLDRYQTAFMRKAMSILHNEEEAKEVVQDTFTKIYVNADSFSVQAGAKFSSWAYKILMNTAFTRYQRLVKQGQRFTNLDPEFEQFIGEKSHHSGFEERRDAIERIFKRLPSHFVFVLRLHYLERYSHEAIAKETGERVGTIKARIHRAKSAFKKESRDGEIDLFSI
ncbi:RNA polymerase sigma factor [Candidatus Kaiserbacteria bacterium]|nr:RNA polymerase sigma factor [Candidatus Kaiserbacteria bacterium]